MVSLDALFEAADVLDKQPTKSIEELTATASSKPQAMTLDQFKNSPINSYQEPITQQPVQVQEPVQPVQQVQQPVQEPVQQNNFVESPLVGGSVQEQPQEIKEVQQDTNLSAGVEQESRVPGFTVEELEDVLSSTAKLQAVPKERWNKELAEVAVESNGYYLPICGNNGFGSDEIISKAINTSPEYIVDLWYDLNFDFIPASDWLNAISKDANIVKSLPDKVVTTDVLNNIYKMYKDTNPSIINYIKEKYKDRLKDKEGTPTEAVQDHINSVQQPVQVQPIQEVQQPNITIQEEQTTVNQVQEQPQEIKEEVQQDTNLSGTQELQSISNETVNSKDEESKREIKLILEELDALENEFNYRLHNLRSLLERI